MIKKYIVALVMMLLVSVVGIVAVTVSTQNKAQESFANGGYVLVDSSDDKKAFIADTNFNASLTGLVSFQNSDGEKVSLKNDSFVHMEDGSTIALADGVLMDFSDLSSNFINNYYITRLLAINESGSGYSAQTDSGILEFGEFIWKLSDQRYLVASKSMDIYMSADDVHTVEGFVEVLVSDDGIVSILTQDESFSTISEACYIETSEGVTIYPVQQLIDNGNYKVSVAKLVVSPDDSIVLTDDEVRRQIVPELNIETIDGADGEDGISGVDGVDGVSGEEGISGQEGTQGTSGANGSVGESGAQGGSGANGSNGANGVKGVDAIVDSSTNTALPSMAITDWNVAKKSLTATIALSGDVDALAVTATDTKDYNGTITLTNVVTGEVIYCYQTDESYKIEDTDATTGTAITGFKNGVNVAFSTKDDPLEPDTQYKLSVNAYYQLNDRIYSREFLARYFYTDSTGTQIVHESSETDSITVSVTGNSNSNVTLYLVTAEQNANFSTASVGSLSGYEDSKNLTFTSASTQNVTFDNLHSDSRYVVRAIVDGLIVNQAIDVYTLKETPTYDASAVPSAYFNRVNGAFEVYRPKTDDPDDGIEKYVYTAYDNSGTAVYAKTLTPTEGEPVMFYLTAGEYYKFGVQMYFNDNAKTIRYDLGTTDFIMTEGGTLPKIEWASGMSTTQNSLDGTIGINLTNETSLTVDANHPLTIEIYADQIYDRTITIPPVSGTESNSAELTDIYKVIYNSPLSTQTTNYASIDVDLFNLYRNTTYTVTLRGTLDLNTGDTEDGTDRIIGTTSFRTIDTPALRATFTDSDGSTAISQNLLLAVVPESTDSDLSGATYAYEAALEGKVTVELYSGTGNSRTYIGETIYSSEEDLKKLYAVPTSSTDSTLGTGIKITEDSFNLPSLSSTMNYTLVISEAVDGTYDENLGYQNEYENITPSSKILTAEATPPDLLKDPANAIIEAPIYNEDAGLYGATYNKNLPDDCVIGYTLASTYDNSQRLAQTISYYLFEYDAFYKAIAQKTHPISGGATKRTITLPVSNTEDTVPKIAVFFTNESGNTLFDKTIEEGVTYANGYYIYQVDCLDDDTKMQPFSRGYRYLFAYDVEYTKNTSDEQTSSLKTYPDDHDQYDDYATYYGCGVEGAITVGKNVAYVLNSGMVNAPKTLPKVYSYVYSSTDTNVLLHYSFDDTDGTINTESTAGAITQIKYAGLNGIESTQDINLNRTFYEDRQWYEISLPFNCSIGEYDLLQPQIAVSDFVIDYTDIMNELYNNLYIKDPVYLAQIPVEADYKTIFATDDYKDVVRIEMQENFNENYISFTLVDGKVGATDLRKKIESRTYALELTFEVTDAGARVDPVTVFLPITIGEFTSSAKFLTSQLGADFKNKNFKVTAKLWYDTGEQGWSMLDNGDDTTTTPSDYFGLQRINVVDNDKNLDFVYAAHYTYGTGLAYTTNGGLMYNTNGALYEDLLKNLRHTIVSEASHSATFRYVYGTSSNFSRYLTVQNYGINENTYNDVENLTGLHIVPKGAEAISLSFDGGNTGNLTTIVPTIGDINRKVSVDRVTLNSFSIASANEIADDKVTVYIYGDKYAAENLSNAGVLKSIELTIDKTTGKFSGDDNTYLEYTGAAGTPYYLVFAAKLGTAQTLLLDTITGEKAVYEFEFVEGYQITPDENGIFYNNLNYIDKSIQLNFKLNEYSGAEARYDIFYASDISVDSSGTTFTEKDVACATYEDMKKDGILNEPVLAYSNIVSVNLTPSIARGKITPGNTYYLRITVDSVSGGSAKKAYIPFTIEAIGEIDAMIYVDSATSNELSYKVSIVDNEFSLMADEKLLNAGAPYAVRFTDLAGNRIYTIYDSQVFNAQKIAQEFTLNNTTKSKDATNYILTGASATIQDAWNVWNDGGKVGTEPEGPIIKPETQYIMHIYALADYTHNGLSNAIDIAGTETKTLDYFVGTGSVSYQPFMDLVDGFWYTQGSDSGKNNTERDVIEQRFEIASRTQQTTDADNVYLNEEAAILSLNGSSCFELVLAESYGIVTEANATVGATAEQHYKKIEYSITGFNATGAAVKLLGTSLDSNATDTLFVSETDSAGFPIYTYTLNSAIERGSYSITIKLYESETSLAADETLSFTYLYR